MNYGELWRQYFLMGETQLAKDALARSLELDSAFAQGYWALWYAAGDIGGGLLNMSVIGRRMRKMSQMMGALTAIEYLEKRYPSPAIRLVAGTLTVFLLGFYVLAQLIAGGKGMALVTGIPYPLALAIASSQHETQYTRLFRS